MSQHEGEHDTTIKKIDSAHSPKGDMGQTYLATGTRVGMRLWEGEQPGDKEDERLHERPYETVGYVIRGRAELYSEGQMVLLEEGDSWLVPAGARHRYRILEPFTAIEATSPPASVEGRDQPI